MLSHFIFTYFITFTIIIFYVDMSLGVRISLEPVGNDIFYKSIENNDDNDADYSIMANEALKTYAGNKLFFDKIVHVMEVNSTLTVLKFDAHDQYRRPAICNVKILRSKFTEKIDICCVDSISSEEEKPASHYMRFSKSPLSPGEIIEQDPSDSEFANIVEYVLKKQTNGALSLDRITRARTAEIKGVKYFLDFEATSEYSDFQCKADVWKKISSSNELSITRFECAQTDDSSINFDKRNKACA